MKQWNCMPAEITLRTLRVWPLCYIDEFVFWSFAETISFLRSLSTSAYKKPARKAKTFITNLCLSTLGWNKIHATAFLELQAQLLIRCRTFSLKPWDMNMCVQWRQGRSLGSLVAQCDEEEVRNRTASQHHPPRVSRLTIEWCTGALATFSRKNWCCGKAVKWIDCILACSDYYVVFTSTVFIHLSSYCCGIVSRPPLCFESDSAPISLICVLIRHQTQSWLNERGADIAIRILRGYRPDEYLFHRVTCVCATTGHVMDTTFSNR